MRHPGLPVATTCGRAAAREASLGASTARDIAGSTSVNRPALPQHWAASGLVPQTGVCVERTTAHLRWDFAHRVPVHLERADGGVMHVGEEALHDAAAKQQDGG